MPNACPHTSGIRLTHTTTHVCEDCVKTGDTWVHLRMCLDCGHVACCDSSKNRHATAHFRQAGHALVRSIEPGERWVWCYVDQTMPGEIGPRGFRAG
ncbi:MAG: UBP-type zinc finger domain-containing protein [Terriglobales bacterium]